ncbi:MAG: hypothetical protein HUU47_05530 [Bacteroidetes bacterium]|nr:hypothetical protein [Bacteroidota bacterium]
MKIIYPYGKICLLIIISGINFLFYSCKNKTLEKNDESIVVAEVGEKKLTFEEIEGVLGKNMTKEDSFLIIKEYIDNWIQKQIMLKNAEKYEIGNSDEIKKQIDEYREDLVLYEFQRRLLSEKLDTLIRLDETTQYYHNHSENFELKQNIIRFVFIKVHKTDEIKYKLWNKFAKSKPEELTKMAIFAIKSGGNAYIEHDKWVVFDDILKVVPINTYNQENFLNNNRKFKIEDKNFVWLINIIDFRIKDNISPFEFVKDNINEIILNKRKKELLNKIEKELVEKAKKEEIIKINLQQYN